MYRKLLVPFDDSKPSRRALLAAMDLVSGIDDAQITALSVMDWQDFNADTFKLASRLGAKGVRSMDGDTIEQMEKEALKEEADHMLSNIKAVVKGNSAIQVEIVNGSPHDAIVAYAENNDYDCIVMGHRGMGVFRGMLGSVAYSVLQKSEKPVLIVK